MRYPGKPKRTRLLVHILMMLLVMGYILAAMRPIPTQPRAEMEWSIRPAQIETASELDGERDGDAWIPFRGVERRGYVDSDGRLLLEKRPSSVAALSGHGLVEYTGNGEALAFRVPWKESGNVVEGSGLPFFRDGRLWLISRDHTGITAVGNEGERQFTLEFGTIVTSMDTGGGLSAIGMLDGAVRIFDKQGDLLWKLGSGEENGAIYGTAVAPAGDRVAYVHGLNPQRIVVYSLTQSGTVKEYERRFDIPLRHEMQMAWTRDGDLLYVETHSGAWMRRVSTGHEANIDFEGRLNAYFLPSATAPLFFGGTEAEGEGGVLTIYSHSGEIYSREDYASPVTMLYGDEKRVYVSTNDAVHKVRVTCK